MPSEKLTQGLIPQMMDAGQKGTGNDPAVFAPGAADLPADPDVAAQQLAEGVSENVAVSRSAAPWSDDRPLSEQMLVYPATSFLAATFVVVSVVVLGRAVRCAVSYTHLTLPTIYSV